MKSSRILFIGVAAILICSVAAHPQSDATPPQAPAPADQTTTPKKKTATHKSGVSAKSSTATDKSGTATKSTTVTPKSGTAAKTSTATRKPHASTKTATGAHKPGVSNKTAGATHKRASALASKTVTTPSGLRYIDLLVGKGPSPKDGDKVEVNYTGRFPGGKVFDTSIGRGPFDFILGRGNVIKGWDEGVASMRVGGKRKLVIPPALAYGERGAGGVIPPNATLEFEVELLKIE